MDLRKLRSSLTLLKLRALPSSRLRRRGKSQDCPRRVGHQRSRGSTAAGTISNHAAASPAAAPAAATRERGPNSLVPLVKSPMVGTFYRVPPRQRLRQVMPER